MARRRIVFTNKGIIEYDGSGNPQQTADVEFAATTESQSKHKFSSWAIGQYTGDVITPNFPVYQTGTLGFSSGSVLYMATIPLQSQTFTLGDGEVSETFEFTTGSAQGQNFKVPVSGTNTLSDFRTIFQSVFEASSSLPLNTTWYNDRVAFTGSLATQNIILSVGTGSFSGSGVGAWSLTSGSTPDIAPSTRAMTAGRVYAMSGSFWTDLDNNTTRNSLTAISLGMSSLNDGMLIRGFYKFSPASYDSFVIGAARGASVSGTIVASGVTDYRAGYWTHASGVFYFNPSSLD